MRLLFFAQAFLPTIGGAERFLDQLARVLSTRGHEVTVLAARVRGSDNRIDAPYRLLRYPKPFSKRILPRHTVLYLLRAHRIAQPECVHAHGGYPQGYAVAAYARLVSLPWVVRPIGVDILPGEGIRKNPVFEARLRRTLCAADRVVAQSIELEDLIRELGVARERIVRIPNGVDLCAFDASRGAVAPEPLVVAMGIFFKKKGFDVLIEAFRAVRDAVPSARLSLAGDGVERAALEALARERGLADAVEFHGVIDGAAKVRLLGRAWVFVSSARREPFSNANLEALAAALPLVATAVGGNREIVVDGENGLLVPPDDAGALSRAIIALLRDPLLRARFGARSRQRAEDYAWERVAGRYEDVYRAAAAVRT